MSKPVLPPLKPGITPEHGHAVILHVREMIQKDLNAVCADVITYWETAYLPPGVLDNAAHELMQIWPEEHAVDDAVMLAAQQAVYQLVKIQDILRTIAR